VTSFVGREKELAQIRALFGETRPVTLTGTGGCGKTRLALPAAADLLDGSGDGVWLVELAAQVDPGLVPQAAASALGLREEPGRPGESGNSPGIFLG
jgi:predicted ATPase